MSLKCRFSRWGGGTGWFGLGVLALLAGAAWGAQTPAKTNAPVSGKTAAPTNAPPKELITSVFEIDLDKGGRDPFFPNSTRRPGPGKTKTGGGTGERPTPTPAVPLPAFSGLIKGARSRIVLLNDQPFRVGEKAKLPLGGALHEVWCREIRDDAVVITIDGTRQETIPIPPE